MSGVGHSHQRDLPLDGEFLRARFHRYLHAREHPDRLHEAYEFVQRALAEADPGDPRVSLEAVLSEPQPTLADPMPRDAHGLLFHAPLGLLEGAWLQAAALVGNGHDAAVAQVLAAYLTLLGDDEAAAPAWHYRAALARAGVSLPAVGAWQFARDERIALPALAFACQQLALGLHAAVLLPEVIGYTLAYARGSARWRLWGLDQTRREHILHALDQQARLAWHALPGLDSASRVRRGYDLFAVSAGRYEASLDAYLNREVGLAEEVGELFRRKAPYARGYHGRVALEGRTLDDRFAEEPFDAAGFLSALSRSPWFAGAAGKTEFDRLTGFGGPMFGVFSAAELNAIAAWRKAATLPTAELPSKHADSSAAATRVQKGETTRSRRLDTRGLFHRLVNDEYTSALRDQSHRLVERHLRRAARARSPLDCQPDTLPAWVDGRYAEQVRQYRPLAGQPRLNRAEYVWVIRQFAPAILVDGCWLQYQGEAQWQGDRVRRLLHSIYADELGAGDAERNHPNVYRVLLASAGIDLPPFASEAFAQDPSLLDSAFDLPAYLLAISRFPSEFLPETLGLNLAIELSGLGADYRRLADELRYWGFDPLIVTLHQSIDTLAGGHAALARDAILTHLDEMEAITGVAAVAQAWRRIACGYATLAGATRRFRLALALGLLWRFGPGHLSRALRGLRRLPESSPSL